MAWWQGIAEDFSDVSDLSSLLRILMRLLIAALVGGVLGLEREWMGKQAGLRTHMLVALGAALFVVAPLFAGIPMRDVSRVIQGVVTGVGFVGGGAILKLGEEGRVKGLTTATSIWMAAALGVAAGLGRLVTTLLGAVLALAILTILYRFETWMKAGDDSRGDGMPPLNDR